MHMLSFTPIKCYNNFILLSKVIETGSDNSNSSDFFFDKLKVVISLYPCTKIKIDKSSNTNK